MHEAHVVQEVSVHNCDMSANHQEAESWRLQYLNQHQSA